MNDLKSFSKQLAAMVVLGALILGGLSNCASPQNASPQKNKIRTFTSEETGQAFHEMGMKALKMEDYDQAIEYFNKALQLDLKAWGANHPYVASVWHNLGVSWAGKGEYDKAIEYETMALNSYLQIYGEDSQYVALVRVNLASTLEQKGDYDKAIENYEKYLVGVKINKAPDEVVNNLEKKIVELEELRK